MIGVIVLVKWRHFNVLYIVHDSLILRSSDLNLGLLYLAGFKHASCIRKKYKGTLTCFE